MAVVIRLQGLKITAGSLDIRRFFTGLNIPEGGVHILGGEREEAFIIFASDEDARRAMTRSKGLIKGSPVTLLLSSMSEMQRALDASTRAGQEVDQTSPGPRRPEARGTPHSFGYEKAMKRGGRHRPEMDEPEDPLIQDMAESGLYVFLKGMIYEATKEDVLQFFLGLQIDEVVFFRTTPGKHDGRAVVKFRTREDAAAALTKDREYLGARFVEVSLAKYELHNYIKHRDGTWIPGRGAKRGAEFYEAPSQAFPQRYLQDRARSRSPVDYRARAPSPRARAPSPRARAPSPIEECCVLLENLTYSVQKRDIKDLFRFANLQDDQILYLLDNEGKRTRSLFVLFTRRIDFNAALDYHKQEFLDRCLYISPISKEKMISILEKSRHTMDELPGRDNGSQLIASDPYDSEKVCVHVRNLPFDVRKVEILDFFREFIIPEGSVIVLQDNNGVGLGEALVIFQSEEEAMGALSENGRRFLGSLVMLTCITRSQMLDFVADPGVKASTAERRESYQSSSDRNGGALPHPRDMEYSRFQGPPEDYFPLNDLQVPIPEGDRSYGPRDGGPRDDPYRPRDGGNGSHRGGPQPFEGPTCVKLRNLPYSATTDEVYDFCYGYLVIPGSASLQYKPNGMLKGTATVVFETRGEAMKAIEELSGRPMGERKIHLVFV